MAAALPPLGGLSVNDIPPPGPPPTTVRDLPLEITDEVLASYLAKLKLEELCEAKLLQICMLLRGTNQCNDPDDPLWKAACARFGLTERLVGGTPDAPATPTWHVTFLAMCREVATMVKYSKTHNGRYGFSAGNLGTFADLMDGYLDVSLTGDDRFRIEVLWFDSVRYRMICTVYLLLKRIDNIVDIKYYDSGAEIDDYPGGYTALFSISGGNPMPNDVPIIDMLIAAGADVNTTDKWHYTPLHRAAESGNVAIVERLLAANADVNPEIPSWDDFDDEPRGPNSWARFYRDHYVNLSPLETAVKYGHAAVVELLLAHGANVHANDDEALRQASAMGHDAVVEVLRAAAARAAAAPRVDLWDEK